jgi:hypothetical protein
MVPYASPVAESGAVAPVFWSDKAVDLRAAGSFSVRWRGSGRPLYQVRIVGLTATCEGLHGLSSRSPKAMASTVRRSVRMESTTERVAQPSGGKAMQLYPSRGHAAQLSEQIHLRRWG